jgi:hypothetical protein
MRVDMSIYPYIRIPLILSEALYMQVCSSMRVLYMYMQVRGGAWGRRAGFCQYLVQRRGV